MSAAHLTPYHPGASWAVRLNTIHHELALRLYLVIVLAHWGEHLLQTFQIYVLNWPVPASRGLLGYFFPWVIRSETLHYGYALVMLIGLWVLRTGFSGTSRRWWTLALGLQFFHHVEHLLLQAQAVIGANLGGGPVPMSLVQFWVPRVELHFFYNSIVFVPMAIGMYFHMFPPAAEQTRPQCTCSSWGHRALSGAAS